MRGEMDWSSLPGVAAGVEIWEYEEPRTEVASGRGW
jgi:hypothetical protein